jgi:hypothetical protein
MRTSKLTLRVSTKGNDKLQKSSKAQILENAKHRESVGDYPKFQ